MDFVRSLGELIDVAADSTVSRTVLRGDGTKVVLFSFDEGQELSEHTAAIPVLLLVLEGLVQVQASGQRVELQPEGLVHLKAREPHSVLALAPTKLALIMLDPR